MDREWTIAAILTWTKQYFSAKGVDNPRLDAEVLLSHVLGKDRMYLYVHFDQPLEKAELAIFREMVKKRAQRIPVAYIIGQKEFMGLTFTVSPSVLVPRPDTEFLVEKALMLAPATADILDIGTGSGAIIISLLVKLPEARGTGVDLSAEALKVAGENAEKHQVTDRLALIQSDLLNHVAGQTFDLIVSNPPYIAAQDMRVLQAEVRREPRMALFGGADGLDFYRRILRSARPCLRAQSHLIFEVGIHQAQEVAAVGKENGYKLEEIVKDYAGIERVVVLGVGRKV